MSIQLDWQQDLEDKGWPRRAEGRPPGRKTPRWLRWLLPVVAVAVAVAGIALWRAHNSGLTAAREDVQEAVAYGHWALLQGSAELFEHHLDTADGEWRDAVMAQFAALSAGASTDVVPQVEDIRLLGNLAQASVRWTDRADGESYLNRRWYRLVEGEWRWTRPRDQGWTPNRTSERPHLTLTYAAEDGPIVAPILDELDSFTAALCERYRLDLADCAFSLQWQVSFEEALPFGEREQPLPHLAAATADKVDGAVYLLDVDATAWESTSVRERLARFHPGRVYVAQSRLQMVRPAEAAGLPEATLGEPGAPIQLPTPWLRGVTDDGRAHPHWQAGAERAIADAVLRRVHGPILGTANAVNAGWALHRALLAAQQGMPDPQQWPQTGPAVSGLLPPVAIPGLASLGAALQSAPDETAQRQLAGLVAFLTANWSEEAQALLAGALGRESSLDEALTAALGVDEETFTRDWRAAELLRPESPLVEAAQALVDHARQEAQIRGSTRQNLRALAPLYTPAGFDWQRQAVQELSAADIPLDDQWQVRVTAVGALEDVVWAELEESNGRQRLADLRFFRWDDQAGWRRDQPDPRFWGEERQLDTGLARWRYFAADEAAVQAAAPAIDEFIRQVRADLGLADGDPLAIVVAADTLFPANPIGDDALVVPSPRRAPLDGSDQPAAAALRENAGLILAYVELLRKAASLNRTDEWLDAEWPALLGLWRAELESWNLGSSPYFGQIDAPVAKAVADGNPPTLATVFDPEPSSQIATEGNARVLLALYIAQVHGQRWFEPLFAEGLAATVANLVAELGWTEGDLQADWHRYLEERFREPLGETFRTF